MTKIIEIEGIGKVYTKKLQDAGVLTVEALLKEGATPKQRKALEEKTGIDHKHLLRWINHADLFRIKGIGKQFAELLEAAGVDTVIELSKRDPAHLHEKMAETNAKKKLTRIVPGAEHVASWVAQAKKLKRMISY